MKLHVLLFTMLCTSITLAQQLDDVGRISLSVVTPENSEYLNYAQLEKLRNKVLKIASSNGLSGNGFHSNFVIYPIFEIYEEELVEGMQNIVIVDTEVTLVVKQVETNMIFSSLTLEIEGNGNSRDKAIVSSVSQIPTKGPQLSEFLDDAKGKILAYYESECPNIKAQAEMAANMEEFDRAFGILMSVPSEVSCSRELNDIAVKVYMSYINKTCSEQIIAAKAQIAATDFAGALEILGKVDPSAACFDDAKKLIDSIESKVTAEQKRDWDFMVQSYNDAVSLQKQRINAVKEIAVAYYQRQPPTYNYNMLLIR